MSTAATAAVAPAHGHVDNKFRIFITLAVFLAIVTGVEIVMVYTPFAAWMIITGLVVLSILKFMLVIFIFMHLKWDKPFCTILFFIGLVLAVATVTALLRLFMVGDAYPVTSGPERTPPPAAAAAPAGK